MSKTDVKKVTKARPRFQSFKRAQRVAVNTILPQYKLILPLNSTAVYSAEETVGTEEPEVCFVPLGGAGEPGQAVEQSLLLLGDGLASGAALRQYEALTRRLDLPSTAARRPCNLTKNRYRDIAPCTY